MGYVSMKFFPLNDTGAILAMDMGPKYIGNFCISTSFPLNDTSAILAMDMGPKYIGNFCISTSHGSLGE